MKPITSQTEYELYKDLFSETQKYCLLVTAERNRIARTVEENNCSTKYIESALNFLDLSLKAEYSRLEEMARIIDAYEKNNSKI